MFCSNRRGVLAGVKYLKYSIDVIEINGKAKLTDEVDSTNVVARATIRLYGINPGAIHSTLTDSNFTLQYIKQSTCNKEDECK